MSTNRSSLWGPDRQERLLISASRWLSRWDKSWGSSAKSFASQGQTRTAALSLKLAARDIFRQETGEWPVLLLDDVLSELDARRQEFVLNRITSGQVFITCCEEEKLARLRDGRAFHVKQGEISCI